MFGSRFRLIKEVLGGLCVIAFASCGPDLPDELVDVYKTLPDKIDYNIHVKPILSDKCFACHGPDKAKQKAGLRLDIAEAAYGELPENKGKRAIVPGSLKKSEVYHRIISHDPEYKMPTPEFKVELTDYEKAVIIKWIDEGAEYKPHWAFIKPEKPAIPKVKNKDFVKNPIDNFILKKLEEQGLNPSQPADKELLLRRLSFDMTGLPPTIDEIKAFLADNSANAYEKQVDRLMASVHYGEKMATDWMDLARFADTYGYQVDRYRDMSPWRDWVIKSFNDNRRYDEFITWQLAGDLLPNATREQRLATGFNRLHPLNMEDGIVDEEYRVESVSDRVAVLGDGIMGLTLACAKCHDHKYDPISQKEYYQMYGFFNNINETGQISWDKGTPVPNMMIPTEQQEKLLAALHQKVDIEKQNLQKVTEAEKAAIANWIGNNGYKNIKTTRPTDGLIAYFPMDKTPIVNVLNPKQVGKMDREPSTGKDVPNFTEGYQNKAVLFDGDGWLDLVDVGKFKRDEAFTIGLWVNIPKDLKEGVIFHKNKGTQLHGYRGFHLYLKDNKLEWVMAHTYPENAIITQTVAEMPKDKWVQLTVTYDGSSSAAGTHIFVNGVEESVEIEKDNLYKDIIFHNLVDIIYKNPIEPNIAIGGRWRGRGLTKGKVDEILVYNRSLSALEVLQIAQPNWAATVFNTQPAQLTAAQKSLLEQYYLTNQSQNYKTALGQLFAARSAYVDTIENVPEVMVMQEMEKPRKTYVLLRGQYDVHGDSVTPDVVKSVMPMPANLPKNRLGLAQWLTHKDHPLTARVAVNRYWQNYFGRGIVKTTQDFGNQGDMPTHPELLDWLAVTFMESGWDVKALQKLIVMSATYQQNSYTSPELLEKDKENVWLARGPSMRLTSEMIRDNALAASGLLNPKVGGESVKPYQPAGLWSMNFDPYVQDSGANLYRRSFYTYWRRTIPNPTLSTFDQPERSMCTVKRQKTNTPLQALVLLNDPTFIEASKVIGENMARIADPTESIKQTYIKLTGRTPKDVEVKLLSDVREKEYQILKAHPQKSKGWLQAGAYKIDPALDVHLVTSNAIVASVILNGDVTITKR